MQITRRSLVCLIVSLVLSLAIDIGVAVTASKTTDEGAHASYGMNVLHFKPDRRANGFYDSQMPISALNAVPLAIGSYLQARQLLPRTSKVLGDFKVARSATILATLLLNVLVFLWAYDLYGEWPAMASCLLCMLSPNLIANGTLTTTDMYCAVGMVGSLFVFHRFLLRPTMVNALFGGLALALAQITKSFVLVLYPVTFVILAVVMLRRTTRQSLPPKRALAFAGFAALWFLAVINLTYSFDRTFAPLNSYKFETTFFNRVQNTPLLNHVPVPVPYPFLQGLDMTKQSEETGRSYGNVYLLGQLRDPHDPRFRPFKSYYVVAWFYKTPIGLQILFFLGLFWIARNRALDDFIRGEAPLLMAATVLVLWLSFSKAQMGIRHILPALAVEIVITAAAFHNFPANRRPAKFLLVGLVIWQAASVASYYPQMIPYMNEWLHDRRFAYRILSDSNLDWGQDQDIVDRYLQNNPDVVLDPPRPVTGRILVRADRLTGVYRRDRCCTYLEKQYVPVAQVGYAHFLFVIPPQEEAGAR
jgi:4-amino-4-deoxy-L-arabinose transferase-like glycosyltransferase